MGNVHNDPRDGSGRPADGTPDEAQHRRMDPMRKVALAGGLIYPVTFAASIPQLKLFADLYRGPHRLHASRRCHAGHVDPPR
jgi:hypothetical protein